MAESVGSMYVRLGLNLSELETGFVEASRTVAANISRLNRESDLIRLRSQIEIAGLDETADAEQIVRIRTDALNRQLAIQRDRVRILNTEYRNLAQSQGENSIAAQRAMIRLERERLAMANLEREMRSLNDSNVGTSGATNAAEEATSALEDLQSLLPEIPNRLEAIGMAAGAMAAAFDFAVDSVQEMIDDFRELQKQSYELNMSVNDTKQFLRELALTGVDDIGDLEGYIRGMTDAFVKGEVDDPEFIALSKYGASIIDATGRLKSFKDIVEEVYQAWLKAEEAGEGIEFLQLTGGESGIRDAIQYFQRLKEAREDAAKIYDAGLDPDEMHELDRTLMLTAEQAAELKNAVGNIFTPAVEEMARRFFEILNKGTEFLVENKDAIQEFGATLAQVYSELDPYINLTAGGWLENIFGSVADMAGFNQELEDVEDELEDVEEEIEKVNEASNNVLSQYATQRIKAFKDELEDLQIEIDFGDNDYKRALAELDLWKKRELTDKLYVSDAERLAIDELYALKSEQIEQDRADKLEEIRDKIAAADKTALENRLDEIEKEKSAWLQADMDEAEAAELAQRQIAKAYEEVAQKVRDHYQNAADIQYEMTHSAFEKELRDIEQWKQEQMSKADVAEETASIIAEAAAREAQAFEREVDRIKGKVQSLDDKIFEQEHSQYENDVRKLQQEYISLYQEGLPQDKIERYYQNALAELQQRASKDKDYRESPIETPTRTVQSGAKIIGGDQILNSGILEIPDESLRERREEIGLLADENAIRAQLLQKYAAEGREMPTMQLPAMQLPAMQPVTFETVVTPLNNLEGLMTNILSAMNNREPPSVNVSPNISINLGGAYVFDEALKAALVNDITDEVVTGITDAVQTATSQQNYGYGA